MKTINLIPAIITMLFLLLALATGDQGTSHLYSALGIVAGAITIKILSSNKNSAHGQSI